MSRFSIQIFAFSHVLVDTFTNLISLQMSHSDVATSIEKTIYFGLQLYSVSDNWNSSPLGKNLNIVDNRNVNLEKTKEKHMQKNHIEKERHR